MFQRKPLTQYPPRTLDALRGAIAAALSYQDVLPTDLCVKLDLFREDITQAISPTGRPSSAFNPPPSQATTRPADITQRDTP